MSEEIYLTQNKNAGLGENAYAPAAQDEQLENLQAPDNTGCFGKPDKYDYSNVQLPENYCYDENLLNEFNELAAKYNLSQKSADELMSVAVKLTQLTGANFSKTLAEQQRQKVENYRNSLINDRELGGANYYKTMKTANIAYTEFADDDVQEALNETGLNCHPKIIKMFYKIGKMMQNDSLYPVNTPAVQKENREDILFPTMQ